MVKVELTKEEIELIIVGMTGSQYPVDFQKKAFDLVMKLRELLHGST